MTQRAVKGDIVVPYGHLLIADKWIKSELVKNLKDKIKIISDADLGVVDFHLSNKVGVVYLMEADLVTDGGTYRKKLVKLRQADKCKGVVIAEKTDLTSQYYQKLQNFVVLQLGLVLYPVASHIEAALLLSQMVNVESKSESNPFFKRTDWSREDLKRLMYNTLNTVPNLGPTKVDQLLAHFANLNDLAQESVESLTPIIGRAGALSLVEFFQHK